jgi:hypothetical protein
MMRLLSLALLLGLLPALASACSICGGGITARLTFREHLKRADFVAVGKLQNPQFDPNGGKGRTDFQIQTLLKASNKLPKQGSVAIPRYIPVIGNTPPDYLLCCQADENGQPEPTFGKTTTKAMTEYVQEILKLEERDLTKRLGLAFLHLDSADEGVAADAFLEFAKAPDAEILKAKSVLQPAKLRQLLNNPKTPSERLGVFALLLGFCGNLKDAEDLAKLVQVRPLPETVRTNLGGYLAGLTLLNPELGWKQIENVLVTETDSLDRRLSAIGSVRFFQATRPQESRKAILASYQKLLGLHDLADLAIDDLRRWQWWELSEDVFKLYDNPLYQAMIIKRGIIRYGLQCPNNDAKRFLSAVREKDLKLVQDVEELLKAFEPIRP